MILQLLAIRNNALVIPTTSGMHVDKVLNPLANGTATLRGDGAGLRMAQYFLKAKTEQGWC
jgi:hypothetical protein